MARLIAVALLVEVPDGVNINDAFTAHLEHVYLPAHLRYLGVRVRHSEVHGDPAAIFPDEALDEGSHRAAFGWDAVEEGAAFDRDLEAQAATDGAPPAR